VLAHKDLGTCWKREDERGREGDEGDFVQGIERHFRGWMGFLHLARRTPQRMEIVNQTNQEKVSEVSVVQLF